MADMTNLTRLLRDGDPVQADGQLPADEAQRIRRAVLASVADRPAAVTLWQRPFAFAAMSVVLVVIGATAGHQVLSLRGPEPTATAVVLTPVEGAGGGERRQLQFSTPGGTRIIWIFDDNLRLQASMP